MNNEAFHLLVLISNGAFIVQCILFLCLLRLFPRLGWILEIYLFVMWILGLDSTCL